MAVEFSVLQLAQIFAFVLTIIGAGAAVRSSVLNSTVKGWKEQAEQLQARQRLMQEDLESTKRKLDDMARDYSRLSAEHDKVKDKYTEVLNESRTLLLQFFEEMRRDVRGIRANMQALRRQNGPRSGDEWVDGEGPSV